MQPWRRATIEAGLSLAYIAAVTGKSVDTVYAYSRGVRRPPADWVSRVEQIASDVMRARA
jgi:predicted transcriptional regulator